MLTFYYIGLRYFHKLTFVVFDRIMKKIRTREMKIYIILSIFFLSIFINACNQDQKGKGGEEKAKDLLKIAVELINTEDSLAFKYSLEALELSRQHENAALIGESFLLLGHSKKNLGQLDTAITLIKAAIKYLESENEKRLLARSYSKLAQIYLESCNYQRSYEYFKKGIEIAEEIDDISILKQLYTNISTVFIQIGNYDRSLEYLYKAMEVFKKGANDDQYILLRTNLVSLYNECGKYQEALKTAVQIKSEVENLNDSMSLAIIYNELSNTYLKLDNLEKANENIDKAFSYIVEDEKKFPPILKAYIYTSKGNIFKSMDELDSAIYYYQIAREIYASNRHISGASDILMLLASIDKERKNYSSAKKLLLESTKNALKVNYKRLAADNYKLLSDINSEEGNASKALEYYKKHIEIKDSLFNQRSDNRLLDLQISYETREKQQENTALKELNSLQRNYFIAIAVLMILLIIVILSRYKTKKRSVEALTEKNEIISVQNNNLDILNKQLSEANATKDKFFLILSHELLNPVKWMDNVAKMLRNQHNNMTDEELDQAIAALSQSSSTSTQLLDNLLTWSKIQVGRIEINNENVNVHDLLNEIENMFKAKLIEKHISIENHIANDLIINTDKQMLQTIFRNLIDNAIKFSYPGGNIIVSSSVENNRAVIKIRDFGTGIKESDRKKIFDISKSFSTFGTNREKGSGIGLILCKEYIAKSGGSLDINTNVDKGTEMILKI